MFPIRIIAPLSGRYLTIMLDALTRVDIEYLRLNPTTPTLYQSGVRYRQEPFKREDWCSIPEVIDRGWGDCEDLACWRAAELTVRGEQSSAFWEQQNTVTGRRLYHILVRRSNASIEDPSRVLGMGG